MIPDSDRNVSLLKTFCWTSRKSPTIFYLTITTTYRSFSHDVTAAILVWQNNETAAMLVYQENPVGIENLSRVKNLSFQEMCIAADHVSENDL